MWVVAAQASSVDALRWLLLRAVLERSEALPTARALGAPCCALGGRGLPQHPHRPVAAPGGPLAARAGDADTVLRLAWQAGCLCALGQWHHGLSSCGVGRVTRGRPGAAFKRRWGLWRRVGWPLGPGGGQG